MGNWGNCCSNKGISVQDVVVPKDPGPPKDLGFADLALGDCPFHCKHSPDAIAAEKELDWVNAVVKACWPYFLTSIETLFKEIVEPEVSDALPGPLKNFSFTRFCLGDSHPRLGPVTVYTRESVRYPGIELFARLVWKVIPDIQIRVNHLSFGINEFSVDGHISVVLRPLMSSLPTVGGLQLYMTSAPEFDWNFDGALGVADLPVIRTAIHNAVTQLISHRLVLPNRVFVHWVQGREGEINITSLKYPVPEGVLRVGVVEARNIKSKESKLANLFSPSSKLYAVVIVGDRRHRTSSKSMTEAPTWNHDGWADFLIFSMMQPVTIEVYHTNMMEDALIGRVSPIQIYDVFKNGDQWYPLVSKHEEHGQVNSLGEVRIVARCYECMSEEQLLHKPSFRVGKANSAALLTVELRALRGLPPEKATGAVVELTVEDQSLKSIESQYVQPSQDFTYDLNNKEIDPAAQRLAAFLQLTQNLPLEQIADISGLDLHSLTKILREKPLFTTRWNQGFNILLCDPCSAVLELELLLRAPGRISISTTLTHKAKLEEPFQINRLLSTDGLSWEGLLAFQPEALDLDIKLTLFTLKLATNEDTS